MIEFRIERKGKPVFKFWFPEDFADDLENMIRLGLQELHKEFPDLSLFNDGVALRLERIDNA